MPYIPPNTLSLKTANLQTQSRIALMGYPFTGKTFSALTFPNPVVVNLDNKLGAHHGRDVLIVPFHDAAFVDSLVKRKDMKLQPNVRNAVELWLMTEALKLEPDQTLILDSWTMLSSAQEQQEEYEPVFSAKTGGRDTKVAWANKLKYFERITRALRELHCDVVVTFHEQAERYKDGMNAGDKTGKVRPLMNGSFKDQLMKHFTDFFRQHAIDKPAKWTDLKLRGKQNEPWIQACYESTPTNIPAMYLWQTYSDDIADCGSTLNNPPPFIPANYAAFKQYKL